jgi:hypothetical protein
MTLKRSIQIAVCCGVLYINTTPKLSTLTVGAHRLDTKLELFASSYGKVGRYQLSWVCHWTSGQCQSMGMLNHSCTGHCYTTHGASNKSFTTLKAYIDLFGGHVQCLELS